MGIKMKVFSVFFIVWFCSFSASQKDLFEQPLVNYQNNLEVEALSKKIESTAVMIELKSLNCKAFYILFGVGLLIFVKALNNSPKGWKAHILLTPINVIATLSFWRACGILLEVNKLEKLKNALEVEKTSLLGVQNEQVAIAAEKQSAVGTI